MKGRTLLSAGLVPLSALVAAAAPACAGAPQPARGEPSASWPTAPSAVASTGAPPSASATASSAAGAPPAFATGVIARATTRSGLPIVVEQSDGERRLLVDGVVQGRVRLDSAGVLDATDPVREIMTLGFVQNPTVLVIGLGTGHTAQSLVDRGMQVEVVESEPAVIALARQHFGFSGHVIEADGARYVSESDERYGVVLVDAFVGDQTPESLRDDRALRALRERVGREGLLVYRLIASPRDPAVADLRRRLGFRCSFVLGDGIGDETQTLYLVGTMGHLEPPHSRYAIGRRPGDPYFERPLRLVLPGVELPDAHPERGVPLARLGYLVLVRGQACLDLPHGDMGAVRFRLLGDAAEPLRAKLERVVASHERRYGKRRRKPQGKHGPPAYVPPHLDASKPFPTAGDIGTDGSLAHTLAFLIRGGGVKRSDVRFSPVIAAVRGWAKPSEERSVFRRPPRVGPFPPLRGAPSDSMLPYGGRLYDLTVDEVIFTYDRSRWDRFEARLRPWLVRTKGQLVRVDLRAARASLRRIHEATSREFGPMAQAIAIHREADSLGRRLDDELDVQGSQPSLLDRAAACDRLARLFRSGFWNRTDLGWGGVLRRCAEAGYERVVASASHPDQRVAAARLVHWLDSMAGYELEEEGVADAEQVAARRQQRAAALRQRWAPLAAQPEAPPRPRPPSSAGPVSSD